MDEREVENQKIPLVYPHLKVWVCWNFRMLRNAHPHPKRMWFSQCISDIRKGWIKVVIMGVKGKKGKYVIDIRVGNEDIDERAMGLPQNKMPDILNKTK